MQSSFEIKTFSIKQTTLHIISFHPKIYSLTDSLLIKDIVLPQLKNTPTTLAFLLPIENSNVENMIFNEGVRTVFKNVVMKNIYTNYDVLMVEYGKNEFQSIAQDFVMETVQLEVSKVLHGCVAQIANDMSRVEKQNQSDKQKKNEKENVIVTGGSKGIGAKTVENFAKRGYNVFLTGRPGNKSIFESAELFSKTYQIKAQGLELDIGDQDSISSFTSNLKSLNVPISTLILNAAVGTKTSEQQTNSNSSCEATLININTIGTINLFNSLQKQKVINENTMIFVVSSVLTLRPFKQMNAIDACSKAMLQGWVKQIQKDFNVAVIYPGATDTYMFEQSTLSSVRKAGKLEQFIYNFPKRYLINPDDIGKIIAIVSSPKFRNLMNGVKIAACCGMHYDFSPLPHV